MAENEAGSVFVRVIGDSDRAQFAAAVEEVTKGIVVEIPVTFKMKKGAVGVLVKEAKAEIAKRKDLPSLGVKLHVAKGEVKSAIAAANAHIKTLKQKPSLNVGLSVTATEARRAITEANARLKAAKVAAPKLKVELDLNTEQAELIKELRVKVKSIDAQMKFAPIELPVELDPDSIKALGAKALAAAAVVEAQIKKRLEFSDDVSAARAADAARVAAARVSATQSAQIADGLDKRSLMEQKYLNQVQLLYERAELAKRASSAHTFRQLRNDLSQFDASTTRFLRRATIGFGLFTGGVVAGFAAVTVAALASFGRTELAVSRAAGVLASNEFVKAMEQNQDGAKAFRDSLQGLRRELQGVTEDVAVETIFDPTEVAEGAKALAQAGLDIKGVQGSLQTVAEFAQNQEIDLATATEQLTGSVYAVGVSARGVGKDMLGLADKFTFVANATNASATDIADAFSNRAAASFRTYGQSIEQTLTVLALFAKANVRGKTAGEQTSILIREISKAPQKTKESAAAWKRYGIEFGKANGKLVPFTTTLAQLALKFDQVRREKGPQELAALIKELGLTVKSSGGLMQLLPQIVSEGTAGMEKLEKQIGKSTGALKIQSEVIKDNLAFQFEKLTNEIGSLTRTAAGPLATEMTAVFKELNGDVEGSVGIAERLTKAVGGIGEAVSKKLGPAIRRFTLGGEGEDFLQGIVDGTTGVLRGFSRAFGEFRDAAFGEGSSRGFFSTLGAAFAALGRFSQETLPKIGRGLGIIVGFIRENGAAVKAMLAAWLGLFLVSKSLRLFLIPLVSLTEQTGFLRKAMASVVKLQFAQSILGSAGVLGGFTRQARAATVAANALAAAEARHAAAQVAAVAAAPRGGFKAVSTKATAINTAAEVGAASAAAMKAEEAAASVNKLSRATAALGGALRLVAKLFVPVVLGVGIVQGAVKQLNVELGPGGLSNALTGLARALKGAFHFVSLLANGLAQVVLVVGQVVGAAGVAAASQVIRALGTWGKLAAAGISGLVGFIGTLVDKIAKLIGAGDKLKDFGAGKGSDGKSFWERFKDTNSIDNYRAAWGRLSGEIAKSQRNHNKALGGDTIAKIFDQWSTDNVLLEKNISINKKRREEAAKVAASIEREAAKIRVMGVTQDFALGKARALAAGNRGLAVALAFASQSGTVFDKRQRSLALVMSVLQGRTKNLALRQIILANASASVSQNMAMLAGTKGRINGLMTAVTQGSQSATRELLRLNSAAIEAARALQIQQTMERAPGGVRIRMLADIDARSKAQRKRYVEFVNGLAQIGKEVADKNKPVLDQLASGALDAATESASNAANASKAVQTAAEKAEKAVNKLTIAQFRGQASALIGRIGKTAGAYKATAFEAALLAKAMPAVDRALETQKAAVEKLNTALTTLQATQLEGTKAFSDQAFALDQQIKAIQLQKLDLQIAGTSAEDPGVKALDAQIAALQQQTERVSLVESLQLDPLKRKLEETFTPVKELSFQTIIDQFKALNQQKVVLDARVGKGETLKAKLDAVVAGAADKFAGVGLSVTQGISVGLNAGRAGIVKGARDTTQAYLGTLNQGFQFGSPSKVTTQRGLWVSQGLASGIASGRPAVLDATRDVRSSILTVIDNGVPLFFGRGKSVLGGFLQGMAFTYKTDIQPFVLSIAEWIKDNKGPISYDAQLLRPAGAAMMSGFHSGLRDGFGEVRGWVKKVGPQIGESFPNDLFFERSARFLLNNVKADTTFSPEDAFSDLLIDPLSVGGAGFGSLSFLHKTKSFADTLKMGQMIARLYGMTITGRDEAAGHVVGSQHPLGQALDLSNSAGTDYSRSSRTPEMGKLRSELMPFLGKYLKQVIYAEKIYGAGGGPTGAGGSITNSNPHNAHVHIGWLPDFDFSHFSGKLGSYGVSIPGVPADVLEAINYASEKTKLDPRLIAAVMKQESGFRKNVVSFDGGHGLMQLTSAGLVAEARSMGSIFDPKINALVGAKYLRDLINQLGSLKLGLSAYNSGPGGGERYGHIDVPSYVASVLRFLEEIKRLTGSGVGTFRAQGGPLNANQASWVGERGRELWVPDRSGTVISNRNVEAMMRMSQNAPAAQAAGATYSPTFQVSSNSPDPAVVAALVDARMRAQTVGVRN